MGVNVAAKLYGVCIYVRKRETLGSTVTTELFSRGDPETHLSRGSKL